jgi:polysaccharide pyruvyl transferase CsaB
MKKHKKIVMACGDGTFNLGDEAISASFIENYNKIKDNSKIILFSSNPKKTYDMHKVKSIKMDLSIGGFIKGIIPTIKAFKNIDILVWGGGNLITDGPSLLFTPFHLLKIIIAKAMNKKVIIYAVGVGPLHKRFTKILVKYCLNKVDKISVRDEWSKKQLEEIGVKNKIYCTTDPAFILGSSNKNNISKILAKEGIDITEIKKKKEKLIGIAPRRVFHRKSGGLLPIKWRVQLGLINKKDKLRFLKFKKDLANAADEIIEKHNAKIVFIPMQSSSELKQDDHVLSKEIINMMKNKKRCKIIKSDKYKLQELKGIYGMMDLILSIRCHALILGSSMNVPVVSLAYSPKGKRFSKILGIEDYCLPVEEANNKNIFRLVNKALLNQNKIKKQLNKSIRIVKKAAEFNIELVNRMIK